MGFGKVVSWLQMHGEDNRDLLSLLSLRVAISHRGTNQRHGMEENSELHIFIHGFTRRHESGGEEGRDIYRDYKVYPILSS